MSVSISLAVFPNCVSQPTHLTGISGTSVHCILNLLLGLILIMYGSTQTWASNIAVAGAYPHIPYPDKTTNISPQDTANSIASMHGNLVQMGDMITKTEKIPIQYNNRNHPGYTHLPHDSDFHLFIWVSSQSCSRTACSNYEHQCCVSGPHLLTSSFILFMK